MKKFLLTVMAAMLLPMAFQANAFETQQLKGVLNQPLKTTLGQQRHLAPAKADLADNQRIMGHYDTDDVADANSGLGLTSFAGTIPIGTILTSDEMKPFDGGKIVAIRVGLANAADVTRVFVIPVTAEGSLGTTTEWSCSANAAGWNTIELETPYDITVEDGAGLMIGFDYTQTSSNYPISAVEVGDIYESYCYLTYQGSTSWYNISLSSYGNLSVQAIVESDNFAEYEIIMGPSLSCPTYVQKGTDLQFAYTAKNFGTKALEAGQYTFDYAVDGTIVGTITGTAELVNTFVEFSANTSTDELATGKHVLTVWPATMNGETIEDADTLAAEFIVYTTSMPRQKQLIEQLTSSSCTYCPLGTSMLQVLEEKRDDLAWVAIHGTLNSSYPDPYDYEQCDTLNSWMGLTGWPSGALNRVNGWSGEDGILGSLGYYADYHDQVATALSEYLDAIAEAMPTFASIDIASTFDESTREANITVSGEAAADFYEMMGEDACLTVYLIEDTLVSKQLNNGSWVAKYKHNGVLRQALPGVAGTPIVIDGTTYEHKFNYTLPADWDASHMRVVAFISRPLNSGDFNDMYVNNTELVKLGKSTGIIEVLTDGKQDVVPVAYYDIMGHEHSSLQPGINIVKMSDGSAYKVMGK